MANNNIKGIGIELSAVTTQLSQSLKDALKPVKDLQNGLKDIDRLLKFNPNGANLLNTRLALLKKEVEALSKSYADLSDKMKIANERVNSGELDKTSKEYKDLVLALDTAKTGLNYYNKEIADTERALHDTSFAQEKFGQSIDETNDRVSSLSSTMSTLGNKLLTKVKDEIKEMAKEIYNASLEIEYLESDIRALYSGNVSEKTIQSLTDYAKELSTQTVYSTQEIQKAMSFMARAGFDAEQTMLSVKSALDLAQATGEDSSRLASILVDGLTAFNMEAEESSRFANVLSIVANETNAEVSDLGESFKYAGALAGTFGFEVEDVAVALGVMASQGIKGSQAGTTLRSMFTRLATNTGHATDVLKSLGVEFFDSEGKARNLNEVLEEMRSVLRGLSDEELTTSLKAIGGQNAITGLTAIISATDEEWESLKSAVADTSQYIENVADIKTDNLQSDIQRLKNTFIALGTDALEPLNPIFRSVVQDITKGLSSLRGEFSNDTIVINNMLEDIRELQSVADRNATSFDLSLLRTGDEVKQADELVARLKEINLTEEERKNLQDELKTKLDLINQTLGTDITYNGQLKALQDVEGKIDSLEVKYGELSVEARKSFYTQEYEGVVTEAIEKRQKALDVARESVLEYYRAIDGLTDKEKQAWDTYNSLSGTERFDFYQNISETDWKLKEVIDTMSTLKYDMENAPQSFDEVSKSVDGIVEAYRGIGEAVDEQQLNSAISNLRMELDFADETASLETYEQKLKDIQIKLANPEQFRLEASEVTDLQQQEQYIQSKIAKEQEYQNQLKQEQAVATENATQGKQQYNDMMNGADGIVSTSQTGWGEVKSSFQTNWDESMTYGDTQFRTMINGINTYLSQNPFKAKFKAEKTGGNWFESGSFIGFNSGGFSSGGMMSNSIVINNTFTINGNDGLTESALLSYADIITDRVNENLGRMI